MVKGVLRQHPCDTGDDPEDWRLARCRNVRIERELLVRVLELREMLGLRHCGWGCGCCAEMFERRLKLFLQPRVAFATNLNSTYSMPLRLKLELPLVAYPTPVCILRKLAQKTCWVSLRLKIVTTPKKYLQGLISVASNQLFFFQPSDEGLSPVWPILYPPTAGLC